MASDLATPWQDLGSALHTELEGNKNRIEEVLNWAIEYLGKSESIKYLLIRALTFL